MSKQKSQTWDRLTNSIKKDSVTSLCQPFSFIETTTYIVSLNVNERHKRWNWIFHNIICPSDLMTNFLCFLLTENSSLSKWKNMPDKPCPRVPRATQNCTLRRIPSFTGSSAFITTEIIILRWEHIEKKPEPLSLGQIYRFSHVVLNHASYVGTDPIIWKIDSDL